jgi:hypothetical protein
MFVALLLALVALTAACKSGDDAAEPTTAPAATQAAPTPRPTATPTPRPASLEPIAINPEDDPEGYLAALPRSEVECAEKVVGGHAQLVDVISDESDLDPGEVKALGDCISKETAQRTLIGALQEGAGTLSDETLDCVTKATEGVNFASQFTDVPQPEDITGMFQAIFCLSDEERVALEDSDSEFALGEDGPGIDQLECAFDTLGPEKVASAFGTLSTGDLSGIDAEFLRVAASCGVFDQAEFEESGMTIEQMACLLEKAGPTFQGFLASSQSGQPPDLSVLSALLPAFEQCGVDFNSLGGGAPGGDSTVPALGTPPAGGTGAGPQLTAEQAACFSAKLSPEVLLSMQSGAISPESLPALITAAAECGIDAGKLFPPPQ